MGRAPSKSVVFFSEDNVFDDRDTCLDLCWKPAQLCVHAGEILAEWRIWQWGPNFQQQRVSYISIRYSFPFIGNTVCPGPPWLLELRGPYGSGCLSGSAMHEFKSLTRSLDVWIQIVIIRVAETVDFTFVQFKISTMVCQLNTQYTQEVYKLHKHAGFWIQQTLSILTSRFLAVNTYTFFFLHINEPDSKVLSYHYASRHRRVHMSSVLLTFSSRYFKSRDIVLTTGRWREMRSEKEQMIVGKEKSVVEIQFRDIPGEQDNASGNTKQKEEKKEVFTKVGNRV